ncbi:MAG: zf-HC2 domain-containing protein [Phycisphaerae bacterium]|nr:MAG: hypothetical protein EDS66_01130 [Planctomycetota bacterium]KAB2947216.1 MAG: hypothetical protein F9K17_07540 [Phycisphaerae bacterium]MBE7458088.1 zf-HC2 domain-containing protein [Planctomycetia bacterium]MCK6464447.1 zf-HC2 domain-containing protein [Phycisphaerae bacterium]MCL4718002.1 zf-HC2 domain-containing protein [Phycisphaerae bacterium]
MRPLAEELSELLSAYLDDEVSASERRRVEAALASDPSVKARFDELCAARDATAALPRRAAPPDLAEAIGAEIERESLLAGRPAATSRNRGIRIILPTLAAAALLMLAVLSLDRFRKDGADSSTQVALRKLADGPPGEAQPLLAEPAEPAMPMPSSTSPPAAQRGRAIESDDVAALRERVSDSNDIPAERPPALVAQRLLAVTGIDQKLQAGVTPDQVREHRFDNESAQIRLTCADAAARDAALSAITEALSAMDAANLAEAAPAEAKAAYLAGQPGVNFESPDERQVLVRIPRAELDQFLEQIRPAEQAGVAAELRLGRVVARGWTSVEPLLAGENLQIEMIEDDGSESVFVGTPVMRVEVDAAALTEGSAAAEYKTSEDDAETMTPPAGFEDALKEMADSLLARREGTTGRDADRAAAGAVVAETDEVEGAAAGRRAQAESVPPGAPGRGGADTVLAERTNSAANAVATKDQQETTEAGKEATPAAKPTEGEGKLDINKQKGKASESGTNDPSALGYVDKSVAAKKPSTVPAEKSAPEQPRRVPSADDDAETEEDLAAPADEGRSARGSLTRRRLEALRRADAASSESSSVSKPASPPDPTIVGELGFPVSTPNEQVTEFSGRGILQSEARSVGQAPSTGASDYVTFIIRVKILSTEPANKSSTDESRGTARSRPVAPEKPSNSSQN